MVKDLVWYKRNVNYNLGVRKFPGDKDGVLLSAGNPYVSIEREELRDFKMANKRILIEGQLLETTEPSTEWETSNSVSDTEITELTGNHLKLKSRLPSISSVPILYKILEDAKTRDRAKRVINMIQGRIDELEEEVDFASNVLKRND